MLTPTAPSPPATPGPPAAPEASAPGTAAIVTAVAPPSAPRLPHPRPVPADAEVHTAVAELLDRSRWREHVERVATLSRRELAILLQLGSGASNCTIAHRLRITERTVKAHIGRILSKLRLESRLQAGLVGYLWAQAADHAATSGSRG